MWFRLALALKCSVREAQARITSREFAEWIEFDRIDPIGAVRGDLQAAVITAHLMSALAPREGRPYRYEEFMPLQAPAKPKRQSAAELKRNFQLFVTAHNAAVKRKG